MFNLNLSLKDSSDINYLKEKVQSRLNNDLDFYSLNKVLLEMLSIDNVARDIENCTVGVEINQTFQKLVDYCQLNYLDDYQYIDLKFKITEDDKIFLFVKSTPKTNKNVWDYNNLFHTLIKNINERKLNFQLNLN
jgi:hypothetical protein